MIKVKAYKGGIYHICNKSISHFGIFKNKANTQRFLDIRASFSEVLKKGKYRYWNIIV